MIRQVLDDQVMAWNDGDLEGFMQGYWQSEDLTFESPDAVTKGWQATLERYQRRYPDRATMGILSFSNLVIDATAPDEATVTGRFHLQRKKLPPAQGQFVLSMRQFDDGWRIVRDRTWSDSDSTREAS